MSEVVERVPASGVSAEALVHERYALLGSVASIVAHEFNNLMTPVLARSQAALTYDDARLTRKALECTVSQTQRAIDICRRLLELANCRPVEQTVVPVAAAVQAALTAAARPLEKDNIVCNVQVSNGICVRADAILFQQILLSFIQDARERLTSGGRLEISARPEGDCVRIEVSDSSSRFTPEQIERVVNPFLRSSVLERPADDANLGHPLNAVRTIAHLHEATIQAVASESGCTFRLRWPAAGQ